ncbi:hypothetical protein CBR64_12040 [Cellulosimicrobium cellulans]|uniref:Uncharacterized protein n=1 Tax=Cellulosimicrobium cellulans TaxID=1710 RepID=A0A1Y0HXQ8_CELCE|nr:hypothetical protein [Cellulosimicrobium cellulans]ARU52095.1 hypothetical protein CBR64_12040 [Cellulosimicrobium cellulans]
MGLLAAAVLWMHVLAGSSSHHGVALPDVGSGHGGPVTLLDGPTAPGGTFIEDGEPPHAATTLGQDDGTTASGLGRDDATPASGPASGTGPVLSAGADAHGGAGPLCLMVLVALVTLAARVALRRRAPWPPTRGDVPLHHLRAALPDRPPDLHALGISRT